MQDNQGANSLISLNLEKISLGALFKYGMKLWAETSASLSEECFNDADNLHKVIFLTIRKYLDQGKTFDKLLIANDIHNFGIKTGDIDIFEYCNILSTTQITFDGAVKSIQELVKLKICRELIDQSSKIKSYILSNKDKDLKEIVSGVDKINNEKINNYELDDDPVDLFNGIIELIEERGKNPQENIGILTGFKIFDEQIGGIRSGNGLYAISSRPKSGKSTYLLSLAQNVVLLNPDIKVLYLDTEMQTDVSQFRAASSITDVPMWFLESGVWRNNNEYVKRVTNNIDITKKYMGKIYHMNVPNRPVNEISSIVKRWYHKYVGRGNKCLVIYDYLKMTSEKVAQNWSEYQILGDKINCLNELGAKLNLGLFTAVQLNRDAEHGVQNSSAIAGSDRLFWFAAYLGIFRRKTFDEINEEGLNFGTHKLIHLAQRFQGKEAGGHFDMVNIGTQKKPKYVDNFINYNIKNFRITECGTLKDIIQTNKEIYNVKDDDNDGELL